MHILKKKRIIQTNENKQNIENNELRILQNSENNQNI